MTHALEESATGHNMAYVGEPCWHGLGINVAADIRPKELMRVSGNDFTTKLISMRGHFEDEDGGGSLPTRAKKMLVRMQPDSEYHKTELSVVGADWKPIQNEDAFAFFDEFVRDGAMTMHTAGVIRPGSAKDGTEQVWSWALAKTTDAFECVPGDLIESYFLFANPHVYGKAAVIQHTPTRVVCWNTLSMALSESISNKVAVYHQKKFDPATVRLALGISRVQLDSYKMQSKFLASKRYTQETVKNYFDEVWPATSQKKLDKQESSAASKAFQEALKVQPGVEFAPDSWWNAANAVTFTIDHKLGRSQDNRIHNAWFGNNRNRKDNALKLAVQYAHAA